MACSSLSALACARPADFSICALPVKWAMIFDKLSTAEPYFGGRPARARISSILRSCSSWTDSVSPSTRVSNFDICSRAVFTIVRMAKLHPPAHPKPKAKAAVPAEFGSANNSITRQHLCYCAALVGNDQRSRGYNKQCVEYCGAPRTYADQLTEIP